jgi:hypothetical protein
MINHQNTSQLMEAAGLQNLAWIWVRFPSDVQNQMVGIPTVGSVVHNQPYNVVNI